MISPAARHRAACDLQRSHSLTAADTPAAEQAVVDVAGVEPALLEKAVGQAKSLMHIRMENDLRKLKGVHSRSHASTIKRGLIDHYMDYCQAVLNRNEAVQDVVFNRVVIWCFDVGEFGKGLLLAEKALSVYLVKPCGLRHTLTPEGFNRNLAEVLAEGLADHVLKLPNSGDFIDHLERMLVMTKGHDMNDFIAAKLHRAYAKALEHNRDDLGLALKTTGSPTLCGACPASRRPSGALKKAWQVKTCHNR